MKVTTMKHSVNTLLVFFILFTQLLGAEEDKDISRRLCHSFETFVAKELTQYNIAPEVKDLRGVNLFVTSCKVEAAFLKLEFAYRYRYKGDSYCCKRSFYSECIPNDEPIHRGFSFIRVPDNSKHQRRKPLVCPYYEREEIEKEIMYSLSVNLETKGLCVDKSYKASYLPIFDFINEIAVRFFERN